MLDIDFLYHFLVLLFCPAVSRGTQWQVAPAPKAAFAGEPKKSSRFV
jgi:hypothetical protein